ncbi:MAG: endonuclease/exonuclease/phosphatase family protein [Leeuwenhoekiella sp.]
MKNAIFLLIYLILSCSSLFAQQRSFRIVTVGFYNFENLFDTLNDPLTFDDDRTPDGKDHWTEANYKDKLQNLAHVIADIGSETTGQPPVVLGAAEIENRKVLEDLVNEPELAHYNYGIVHYDSPDRRGIDVALLYRKSIFKVLNSSVHELVLYAYDDASKRAYTRDQLLVTGLLDNEKIHFIINHWPSRSGGEALSQPRREAAATLNRKIVDSLRLADPYSKIITMGDLNDDPTNASVASILQAKGDVAEIENFDLYNPMLAMYKSGAGTLAYRDSWNLFDQIIMTGNLLSKDYASYRFYKAGIFNKEYLNTKAGQYKGYPFRSYANGMYTGGYSDHYPVFIYLIKEVLKR